MVFEDVTNGKRKEKISNALGTAVLKDETPQGRSLTEGVADAEVVPEIDLVDIDNAVKEFELGVDIEKKKGTESESDISFDDSQFSQFSQMPDVGIVSGTLDIVDAMEKKRTIDVKLTMELRKNTVENVKLGISSSSYETSVKHSAEDTEDAVSISSDTVAVFDGAGGEGTKGDGFRASQAAKKGFEDISFSKNFSDKSEQDQKEEYLGYIQKIAEDVEVSGEKTNFSGKTTFSGMKIFNSIPGREAIFVNLGDSAILKIKNGKSETVLSPDDFWKSLENQVGENLLAFVYSHPENISRLNDVIIDQAIKIDNKKRENGEILEKTEEMDAKSKIGNDLGDYINNNKDGLKGLKDNFDYKKLIEFIAADKKTDSEKKENVLKHLAYFNKGSMAFLRNKDMSPANVNDYMKIDSVEEGDVFVTASDGLLDNMSADQVTEILARHDLSTQEGRDAAGEEVISNLHGVMDESREYKHDDIAFVITYIGKKPKKKE